MKIRTLISCVLLALAGGVVWAWLGVRLWGLVP